MAGVAVVRGAGAVGGRFVAGGTVVEATDPEGGRNGDRDASSWAAATGWRGRVGAGAALPVGRYPVAVACPSSAAQVLGETESAIGRRLISTASGLTGGVPVGDNAAFGVGFAEDFAGGLGCGVADGFADGFAWGDRSGGVAALTTGGTDDLAVG